MKKLLIIFIIASLISLLIYKATINNRKNLVVLGDSYCEGITKYGGKIKNFNILLKDYFKNKDILKKYNDNYCNKNTSISDLKLLLDKNKTINKKSILSIINQADYITISLGNDELKRLSYITRNDINSKLNEYKEILNIIIKNSKAMVFVIGVDDSNNNILKEFNKRLNKLCQNKSYFFIQFNDNNRYIFDTILKNI